MNEKLKQEREQQEPTSAQEALAPELAGLHAARNAAPAYSHAQRRGLNGNRALDDWRRAEHEIESAEEALMAE